MNLELFLEPLPNPHNGHEASAQEVWGEIRLVYRGAAFAGELLRHQWDLGQSADWLVDEWTSIATARLPEPLRGGESLADALYRMTQRSTESFSEPTELDAWFGQLYEFRKAHSSRFALRGANIPELIFGINGACGEVSRCDAEHWSYPFDVDAFRRSVAAAILQVRESPIVNSAAPTLGAKLEACLALLAPASR